MSISASARHIELHDWIIGSPLPLPKLLRHPSRIALKFSINGTEEVLSARGDKEDGIWEVDGDVKICKDQLLIATILVYIGDSIKEFGAVTVSYSQLLAHADARPKECYEFIVDGSSSPVLILITCSIRTLVPLPQKKYISASTEPGFSPWKSKSDGEPIGSNRASTPDGPSTDVSVADLERYYDQATSLPDGRKCQALNAVGCAYGGMYNKTHEMEHLDRAISIFGEALQNASFHPKLPEYLDRLSLGLLMRYQRTGNQENLEHAISKSQDAVHIAETNDPNMHRYISHHAIALLERFKCQGKQEDLQKSISFLNTAVGLIPDGHSDKPADLNNFGMALNARFDRLGHVDDLEMAIAHKQKAVDLTPDDHPDKPACLNSLGNAFEVRFNRLGGAEDLETGIVHLQKAVGLTPDGHPDKPRRLNNLGNAVWMRFGLFGRAEDLEIAITHKQKGVDLTPEGHPEKPIYLNNLGAVFCTRFDLLGRVEDLETAVVHVQRAVDLTPDGHPMQPMFLNSLGHIFWTRFERLDHIKDLEMAFVHSQRAVDLTINAHPNKASYLTTLGKAFMSRFGRLKQLEDLRMALVQFSTAASLPTASPLIRLRAARFWVGISWLPEVPEVSVSSPLEPYHVAIDLLPRVAWLGIPMSSQHALLKEVGDIVRSATFVAIKMEEYEIAVELAEAGRSIAWQNLLNLRTPANELRSEHYDLAERLESISRQLNMSVKGRDGTMSDAIGGTEAISRSHVQLALDWDNTVADIRSKPGFESFLKPKSFKELGNIARDGPVIILNVTYDRCDALVLIPEDSGDMYISNIPLEGFSYDKSMALLKELKGLLSSKHLRARDSRKPRRIPIDDGNGPPLEHILRCLWLDVVKPIIDALAYQPRSEDLPHIWWCTTGPLAFLPIHASGLYDTDELGSKLSDYVVSSYTPTLTALLDDSNPSQDDFELLAIAQANAPGASPIPKTEVEVEKIEALGKNFKVTTMTKADATVENVWRGMEKSNWVHLACHGYQNIKEPMKSGLLLYDGTLELQRLIEKPLPLAEFAFLSACQTATGDENIAEESLHLAAGMLFAGYKGVIATMWSIMDDVGPRVAEDVYREMLKDGKPNRKAAAHALHKAVRRLREDPKVDMLHWIPFIHIGR